MQLTTSYLGSHYCRFSLCLVLLAPVPFLGLVPWLANLRAHINANPSTRRTQVPAEMPGIILIDVSALGF